MNTETTKTKRVGLNRVQSFQLCNLLVAEFTSSGKHDADFAAYASEKLGFSVTVGHIWNTRSDLNIPSNRPIQPTGREPGGLLARIDAIEAYLNTQLGAKL